MDANIVKDSQFIGRPILFLEFERNQPAVLGFFDLDLTKGELSPRGLVGLVTSS